MLLVVHAADTERAVSTDENHRAGPLAVSDGLGRGNEVRGARATMMLPTRRVSDDQCDVEGMWADRPAAMAVIVKEGLTPTLAGMVDPTMTRRFR
jgi:hypothetical protein